MIILKSCDRDVTRSHNPHCDYISLLTPLHNQLLGSNGEGRVQMCCPVWNTASNNDDTQHTSPYNVSTELTKVHISLEQIIRITL